VSAAQAEVDAAQAEIRRAQVALDECQILSPISGTLLKIQTRVGERISSNGLAEVGGTGQMVAIAEVYQNDLGRLRKAQNCKLLSPALGEPLQGTVERFGGQVVRQNIFSETPGEQFDQRVVEVRIALDERSSQRASSWTNLQLQALFEAD
jgi:HlyD family secretion protein